MIILSFHLLNSITTKCDKVSVSFQAMWGKVVRVSSKIVVRQFSSKYGLVGVPFDKGQSRSGVGHGPAAIRDAGLVNILSNIHNEIDVKDYGDVSYKIAEELKDIPQMKNYADMVSNNREVSRSVEKVIRDGRVCITLGGDHSIAVGTVDGHIKARDQDVCVMWIDAHADLNTNKTSETGHTHGMPLAILVKELSDYWPYLPGMDWQQPVISIRNVGYIGLRSVDPYERLIIDKLGITAFGMEDVEQFGIDSVVNMTLNKIDPERKKSIHVSFDIDSLDALEAPSTGTAVRGGLTLREGIQIVETIHKTGRLGALDLVEVNPIIGSKEDVKKTVEAAIHIIQAACGHHRRGLMANKPLPLQTFPPKVGMM